MVEVGIRELKNRLSHYVQLARAGETIAITMRDRIVGFISHLKPVSLRLSKRRTRRDLAQRIERLKAEGLISSGGPYRHQRFTPVNSSPGPTMAHLIRRIRDEEL